MDRVTKEQIDELESEATELESKINLWNSKQDRSVQLEDDGTMDTVVKVSIEDDTETFRFDSLSLIEDLPDDTPESLVDDLRVYRAMMQTIEEFETREPA